MGAKIGQNWFKTIEIVVSEGCIIMKKFYSLVFI